MYPGVLSHCVLENSPCVSNVHNIHNEGYSSNKVMVIPNVKKDVLFFMQKSQMGVSKLKISLGKKGRVQNVFLIFAFSEYACGLLVLKNGEGVHWWKLFQIYFTGTDLTETYLQNYYLHHHIYTPGLFQRPCTKSMVILKLTGVLTFISTLVQGVPK